MKELRTKRRMVGEHEEFFYFLTSRLTHVIWTEKVKGQSIFILFCFLSVLNVMAEREELFFSEEILSRFAVGKSEGEKRVKP